MFFFCYFNLLSNSYYFKEPFLEVFIKEGIASKTRLEKDFIEQCSFTIQLVSYEIFKTKLLPPILKSMLRNPEIILECIATVISNISLDLSANAIEITKGFSGMNFISQIVFICNLFTICINV